MPTPIADMVQQMLSAGVPHELIVLAVRTAERSAQPIDETAENRRAWDRERKRESRRVHPIPPDVHPTETVTTISDRAEQERQLFMRGRQLCGASAGGMIANLLRSRGGDVALARAVIELAATKHSPREYIAAATKGAPNGRALPSPHTQEGRRARTSEALGKLREAASSPDDRPPLERLWGDDS